MHIISGEAISDALEVNKEKIDFLLSLPCNKKDPYYRQIQDRGTQIMLTYLIFNGDPKYQHLKKQN